MNVPVEVTRANRHDVLVRWNDGHHSLLLARDLRIACSCAACVEEMTGRKLLNPAAIPHDVHPLSISPVGRYALHFAWSDGHTSGIYTFDHLRAQCRCATCRPDDPHPINPPEVPMTTATITPQSTMQDVLAAYPGAQKAMAARYHVGGCSSCGFQPTDTLQQVCDSHDIPDVGEVIAFIQHNHEAEGKLQIEPRDVKRLLAEGKVKLLDVRSEQEIDMASIDGALPVTDELAQEVLNEWPKNSPIVVMCHLGERSLQAAAYLADKGMTNVKSMRGGIEAWSAEIDPKVPRYSSGCKG